VIASKLRIAKELQINPANEMKHEAPGTQQLKHIDAIDEGANTAQRSDSLVQPINQRFPNGARHSLTISRRASRAVNEQHSPTQPLETNMQFKLPDSGSPANAYLLRSCDLMLRSLQSIR
jgi:hypothetical protein